MPENGLHLGVYFDVTDAEKAVEKLNKKIASIQAQYESNDRELTRIVEKHSELNRILSEEGSLVEEQQKEYDDLSARMNTLARQQQKLVDEQNVYLGQIETIKTSISSTQSAKSILGDINNIPQAVEAANELSESVEQVNKAEEETAARLDEQRRKRLEIVAQHQQMANAIIQQVDAEEQALSAEREMARVKEEVHNLTVADGMEYQSINERLNQMKEAAASYQAQEERLQSVYNEQAELLERRKAILQQFINEGNENDTDTVRRLSEDVAQAERNVNDTAAALERARTAVYDLRQGYYTISRMPMEIDLTGLDQAKADVKQLDAVLKNIQGTAEGIAFPKLSLDVDDSKLQALISKYNELAALYNTNSRKISTLRAQVEELHRVEAEEISKDGVASPATVARLEKYTSLLEVAQAKLETLGVKTQGARDAVDRYSEELERSESVAYKVVSNTQSAFNRLSSGFERVVTRIKNMVFRFVVMRALHAAFDGLKNVMAAVTSQNTSLQSGFNQLKSTLLVALYPVIERGSQILNVFVQWLIKAAEYVAAFIHGLTGADIKNSISNAKKLYDAMNAESNAKAHKKEIDEKIKARQREIKSLEKEGKALKRQYDKEKQAIEDKKSALDDEIDAVNKVIKALRRQEDAEKKAAQALKKSIQDQIDALKQKKKTREGEISDQKKQLDAQIKAIDDEIKALQKQKKAREEAIKGEEKDLAGFDTLQILQGAEEEDPEVEAIDAQIEALEERKDILQETKDEIPTGSDDPLIAQIESQIEALERQKEAIQDVDYSAQIQAQQDLIEKYQDQKNALDKIADALEKRYNLKVDGLEDAKQKLQDVIQKLEEEKSKIEAARNEANKPLTFNADTSGLTNGAEEVGGKVRKIFEGLKRWLKNLWKDIAFSFSSFVESALGILFYAIKDGWSVIKNFFRFLFEMFALAGSEQTGAMDEALKHLKNAGRALANVFIGILNLVIHLVESILKTVLSAIALLLSPITAIIDSVAEKIGWNDWDSSKWNPNNWTNWHWEGIQPLKVPELAKGAVLPGGKPFLAMLGDQPSGQTNIETPEKLMRQIMREEISNVRFEVEVNNHFDGNLSQFARVIQPYVEVAAKKASVYFS